MAPSDTRKPKPTPGPSKPTASGEGSKKRGGFRVGPQHAPKDAYLGKAKKIKTQLIQNAKLKQAYAKTLKKEGLASARLAARGDRTGDGGWKGKGKGKGRAEERAEAGRGEAAGEESEEEDEEDDQEHPQHQHQYQQAKASLADLPHDAHTATFKPGAGRAPRPVAPSRPRPASSSTPAAGEQPKRWAPAKDAKGKQRQPRMGDKMDAMLAKIRKGM